MADDAYDVSLPAAHALESVPILVGSLMDISRPIGKMESKTRIPEAGSGSVPYQAKDVTELLVEIVANSDIVGHEPDGTTVYLMHLSPASADTLATLFADQEDGDPLDAGEDEHDGCEPDPEDVV